MRIIALPLVRPGANVTAKIPVFYSYRIVAPPPIKKSVRSDGFFTRRLPEEGLGKWAAHKATTTWTNFGMAPEGTIKVPVSFIFRMLQSHIFLVETSVRTGGTIDGPTGL
jgi:hypothetical protein